MCDKMFSYGLQLSLVVPTFNECCNVRALLDRISAALGKDGWEIVFVDDDSPDCTAELIREIARQDRRVRLIQRVGRRGLSTACIEGMLASVAGVIAVMDADLQHDERILPEMLSLIEGGLVEVVIGTRYSDGGSTGNWDARRAGFSWLATKASRMVLKQGVSDPMSGFFMLRREVLDLVVRRLSGIGFKILLDIIASSPRELRIAEVPYTFRERYAGESKLDEMVVWEYGMLLADKTVGRFIPVRFLTFAIIGGLGVFVHMIVLSVLLTGLEQGFAYSQSFATVAAMIFNFAVNNVLTYRDQRLRGWRWFRGLASFMIVCAVGAIANVGIATYLFQEHKRWFLAALAGVLVGAVWNYAVTRLYTWGKKER